MKRIIDTDELEKVLNKYEGTNGWASALCDDLRALIASPQADSYGQDFNLEYTCKRIRRLLNAMGMSDPSDGKDHVLMGMLFTLLGTICSKLEKPQADDVPPDVYDIVVDTGDGIYHTAEVVHFQQSGSKRMIQVRFGDTQADDVRKADK